MTLGLFSQNKSYNKYPNTDSIRFEADMRLYVTKNDITNAYHYAKAKCKSSKRNKRNKEEKLLHPFIGILCEFAFYNSLLDAGIETTSVNTCIKEENSDEGYDFLINNQKYKISLKSTGNANSKYILINSNEHNDNCSLKNKPENIPDAIVGLRANFENWDGLYKNINKLQDELSLGQIDKILEYKFVFDLLGFVFTKEDIHYLMSTNGIMPANSQLGFITIKNANYFIKSNQLHQGLDNLFHLLKS